MSTSTFSHWPRRVVAAAVFFAASAVSHAQGFEPIELYSASQRADSFAACAQLFPGGRPFEPKRVAAQWNVKALCSDAFASLYSQTSKTPLLVFERLTREGLQDAKDEERTDVFYADPRVARKGSASLADYKGQTPPVDRGHLAPAADAPSARAMAQSFALSNIVPQDPQHNRKIWSKVEADVRKFASRAEGPVYVVTGPLFGATPSRVGPNGVWKPERMFKLVYHAAGQRAWAYVHMNGPQPLRPPISYSQFVAETGLDLLAGLPVSDSR